jgi:hypothetical protein
VKSEIVVSREYIWRMIRHLLCWQSGCLTAEELDKIRLNGIKAL